MYLPVLLHTTSSYCTNRGQDFKIVHGRDAISTYDERGTVSGLIMKRSFCKICGSSLFQQTAQLQEAGLVSVASGTMDDRSDAQPTLEVWCRNRRQWLTLDHQGEKLEAQ